MYDNKAVLEYWRRGRQQQALSDLSSAKIKEYSKVISRQECLAGKLNNIIFNTSQLILIPWYIKQQDEYVFPCVFMIDLDSSGNFILSVINAFPIITNNNLESLQESSDNYMVLQPPEWLENEQLLTWEKQLAYAQQMLGSINNIFGAIEDGALILPLEAVCQAKIMDAKLLKNHKNIKLIEAPIGSDSNIYVKNLIIFAWIEAAVKQKPSPKYVWLRPDEMDIKYASIFDYTIISDSQINKNDLLEKLIVNFGIYTEGQKLFNSWQQIANQINNKYSERGGINARISQLKDQFKDVYAHNRHMQVLYAIWSRQLELISTWSRIFDFIPILKKNRLKRLYTFFKQNFSGENVTNFNQDKLQEVIIQQLRRAENRERFVADALHQAENDLQQEQLVHDKYIASLNNKIMLEDLVKDAADYWHLVLLDDVSDSSTVVNIDKLIVEHAEYISPMQGAELLAISQSAVIIGNYNPICNPRFSVQIDYALTKHFKLASCDADFEDLQFDGVLASVGNLWNLAAHGKEADVILPVISNFNLQYQLIDVPAESSEITAILDWLNNNTDLVTNLVIYTVFNDQVARIKNALHNTEFANINVRLVQQPCFTKSAISLFSTVYTANDPGPYVFDRGVEILDNLIANTTDKIIVFGDQNIFKPELHSAAGKFAKLLNYKQQEEVDCV